MAATRADIVVLQCDQGMGTLIKIYEKVSGKVKLTHLALIDLGSESRGLRYAGDAVDAVINALVEMNKDGISPKIDLMIVSHQDYDHWSLLPLLKERMDKLGVAISVGALYRGGQRWKSRALTAVVEFGKGFSLKDQVFARNFSDYDAPKSGKGELADLAGVKFRVLAVNVTAKRSVENATSAVIVVDFGGWTSVLPGDATVETLAAINHILDQWVLNPITPCFLVTAPHHGALRTTADNFTTKNPKLEIAADFAKKVSAGWIAASAGNKSQFKHPFKEVLDLLAKPGAGKKAVKHTFVYYDRAAAGWGAEVDTTAQIFTTICSLGDPPCRESWEFSMHAAGKVQIVQRLADGSRKIVDSATLAEDGLATIDG